MNKKTNHFVNKANEREGGKLNWYIFDTFGVYFELHIFSSFFISCDMNTLFWQHSFY